MDNLTHTLTGVMLSRAGLNRVAPQATLALALASNAPDIDIVARSWGSLTYLHHHRGLSHSLLAVPVLALAVAGLVWLLDRRGRESFRWERVYLVALAGVATHPLIDFTNAYGVRLALPFSPTWYRWDIEFLVDVWVWVVFLALLAGPALGRLISGEIGARPGSGRGAAILALLFLAGWWGARDLFHRRAVAVLESHIYGFNPAAAADDEAAARSAEPVPPLRVAALPSPASLFQWHGLVETEGFYQVFDFNVLRGFDPTAGRILYKPEKTPALEAALQTATARRFAEFVQYPYATVDRREDGYRVLLRDMRFPFHCTIDLDRNLRVVFENYQY